MNVRSARLALVPWVVLFAACSGDRVSENLAKVEEALTSNDRILGFEGTISGAAGSDWRPVVGTASSSTTHSEGSHSIALGGNQNPSAISAALTALGTLSAPPSVDVMFQTGYQPQGVYYGQAGLYFTCGTTINNQYLGNVQLHGPTGSFNHYTFPSLPQNVATALSTTNGCTIKVELNLSNIGTVPVLVDKLSFGQATGSGGTGGSSGGAGGGGAAGSSGAGGKAGGGSGAGGKAGAGGTSGGGTGGNSGAGGSGGAGAGGKSGGGGASGSGAGTGGKSGGGGASGAGASGMSGSGGAGAGAAGRSGAGAGGAGAGGTGAGAGGAGGTTGGTGVEFYIDLPVHVPRTSVALGTSGGPLVLSDYVRILASPSGFSSISSVKTTTETNLGVSAETLNLWSEANVVVLRDGAYVHGNLTTEGTVNTQNNVHVTGTETVNGTLTPIQHQSWIVQFPSTNGGPVNLDVSQVRTIAPGAYGTSTVQRNAVLTLAGSGRYTFDGLLDLEPSSTLSVDNTQGPVQIYASGGFTFRGTISPRDPTKNNILIGIAGTGPIPMDASFNAILIAPHGDVTLGSISAGHFGAIYAQSVNVGAHTDFHHRPFAPSDVCLPGAACDGLCQCDPGGACIGSSDCATDLCCGQGECGGPTCGCTSASQCGPGLDCTGGNCQNHCALNPHAPECLPSHCSNGAKDGDETGKDCGGSCAPCTHPGTDGCNTAADCGTGLTCTPHNGGCFGASRSQNVCWPTQCADGVDSTECGSPDSPCGPNCACVPTCDTEDPTSTCPAGDVCRRGLGVLFNAPSRDVCIPGGVTCPSNDPALCGTPGSLCGESCICTPDCSHATCDNPSDGCAGLCPGVCPPGGAGGSSGAGGTAGGGTGGTAGGGTGGTAGAPGGGQCIDDIECPSGYSCLLGADGKRFCRSTEICVMKPLVPPRCGSPGAPCGDACPACTPKCDGRSCGPDPSGCGASCGSCNGGTFCDAGGQCVAPSSDPVPTVPTPGGGTHSLSPLPEAPTTPVGAVHGGFSVSPQGTAAYDIPIEVPPGRAGLEPKLSLHYTGANRYSDQGVGWTLEGLSKITRCPRTQALDGYAAPIRNNTDDKFCLDGQRLTAVPSASTGTVGVYGDEGTEYRTLPDTFSKVISHKDDGDGLQLDPFANVQRVQRPLQGPDWFEVRTRDGRILTFGRTEDSLGMGRTGIRYSWLLNKVEDRVGNTIIVNYANFASSYAFLDDDLLPNLIHPSGIAYTGHGSDAGNRVVLFNYEFRNDWSMRFQQGGALSLEGQRLKTIATLIDNKPVKSYVLHYLDQYVSQMDSIQECAGDGSDDTQCKKPTTFEYLQESGFTSAKGFFDASTATILDVNGDGRKDFLHTYVTVDGVTGDPGLQAASTLTNIAGQIVIGATLSTGVGIPVGIAFEILNNAFWGAFASEPKVHYQNVMSFGTGDRENPITSEDANGLPCPTGSPLYLLDYDRDGKDDIAGQCGGDKNTTVLHLSLSQGTGSFNPQPAGGGAWLSVPSQIDFGAKGLPAPVVYDVDGDGLEDVLVCTSNHSLEVRRRIPGGGFTSLGMISSPPPVGKQPAPDPIPFCADDRPTYNIIDVDGDGVAELLLADPGGHWLVLRYTGGQLAFEPVAFTNTAQSERGHGLTLGDFNGDGLVDISTISGANTIVWINSGHNRFITHTVPRPTPAQDLGQGYSYQRAAILDYDGDGRSDFLEHWRSGGSSLNVVLKPDASVLNEPWAYENTILAPNEHGVLLPGRITAATDLDGDGNPDVFGEQGFYFGSGVNSTLLTRVVDGVGNVTRVSYGGYIDRCSGSTWPETCLKQLTGIVGTQQVGFLDNDGSEVIERTYNYSFKNARFNVAGSGWLGFESSTVSETTGGIVGLRRTTTSYEPPARYGLDGTLRTTTDPGYVYPLAGRPKTIITEEFVTENGSTIQPLESQAFSRVTEVDNTWDVVESASSVPFAHLKARNTTLSDRPIDPIIVGNQQPPHDPIQLVQCLEGFYYPDSYGNDTRSYRTCPFQQTSTTTTFVPDANAWLISNPEFITIESFASFAGGEFIQTWDPEYDSNGLLHSMTRAPQINGAPATNQLHTTTYLRDDFGNPYQIIESVASGEPDRTTTISYDSDNVYPLTVTNALNQVTQVRYDARWGTKMSVVDPNGIASQDSYDGFGLLSETSDAEGTSTYTYSAVSPSAANGETSIGRIRPRTKVQIDTQGTAGSRTGTETREIDAYGRLVRATTEGLAGASVVQERTYDVHGRLARSSLPHVSGADVPFTAYGYDLRDRVTSIQHAASVSSGGPSEQIQYASAVTLASQYGDWLSGLGNGESVGFAVEVMLRMDESGHKDVTISDVDGMIIRAIDGNNVDVMNRYSTYLYDGSHRLTTLYPNGSGPVSMTYDPYGNLLTHSDTETGVTTNTYNGFDELTTRRDDMQQIRTFLHDNLGRVNSIIDTAGLTTWTYDQGANAIGRVSEMDSPGTAANPDGQRISYTYEALATQNRGLLKRNDYTLDGVDYQVGYSYDDLGRTSRIDYPSLGGGAPIAAKYTYDNSGVLTNVDEVGSGTTKALWQLNSAFQGYLTQKETFGNGATTTYGYNSSRRWLESISTTLHNNSIQSLGYTHYDNGQIKVRTKTEGSITINRTHTYDSLGRLDTLQDEPVGGSPQLSAYNYDSLGNLITRGNSTITPRTDLPNLIDTVDGNQYHYYANGNLQARTGPDVPGGTQSFFYTPFDLPSSITTGDGAGAEATSFEYSADEDRIVRRDPDSSLYFVTDFYERLTNRSGQTEEEHFRVYAGGRPIGEIVRKGGTDEKLFFHQDSLGTLETISTDQSDTPIKQDFDPFGAPVHAGKSSLTRVGFTDQQHDDDLGLVDMRGRLYDPLGGRFTTADPFVQSPYSSQGLNRYAYVFNDPINRTDPTGFMSLSDIGSVINGVATTIMYPAAALVSASTGGFGGVGLNLAAGAGVQAAMGTPGGGQAGMPTTAVPSGQVQGGPQKFETPMPRAPATSSSLAKEPGGAGSTVDKAMDDIRHGHIMVAPALGELYVGLQSAWRWLFPAAPAAAPAYATLEAAVGNRARAQVVQAVVRGEESLGALSPAERQAAAQFYRQTADRVGGDLAEAARPFNIDRARYLEGSLKEAPGRLYEWMAKNGFDVL